MSPRSRPATLRRAAPPRFATPVGMDDPPPPPPPMTLDTASNVHPFPATYTLAPVSVEDLDQLWDWVRADRVGTTAFLGIEHPHSQSFFQHVWNTVAQEQHGGAWVRAIRHGADLIGFVVLVRKDDTASLSLYVTPSSRADIHTLVTEVVAVIPVDITLAVVTTDPALIAAFVANDFAKHTVLTRHAKGGVP